MQESVLAHIGAKYYVEVDFENKITVVSPDNIVRNVPTQGPLPRASSDSKYLHRCVQKIVNEAYGEKVSISYPLEKFMKSLQSDK